MRLVVLVALCGCGRIGFDAGGLAVTDGIQPDTTACLFGAFSNVMEVAEFNTADREWAPSISQDAKTLLFSRQVAGTGQDLFIATRSATDQPWTTIVPFTDVNSTGEEDDPTLSTDGTELIIGENGLFRSVQGIGGFSPPVEIFDDNSFSILEGPELTADGLTLYFNGAPASRSQLFSATRSSPQGTFGGFAPLDPDPDPLGDLGWPTLSVDELEMFYSSARGGQRDIWRIVRDSKTDPWGTPAQVPELSSPGEEYDPELSADGTTIWFSSDRAGGTSHDIYVATRACQ